jgi:hypothetical protein
MSLIKEATTWPDAGIAIAGIGFVTAVSMTLIWQIFSTLRSRLSTPGGAKTVPNVPAHAQGEVA